MKAAETALFDLINNKWLAENIGITPDIDQRTSAVAVSKGKDLHLEKSVEETLKLLEKEPKLLSLNLFLLCPKVKSKSCIIRHINIL